MLQHIVLLKWKPTAAKEKVDDLLSEMRDFLGVIPGVTATAAGAGFGDRSKGYTHAFTATVTDRDALEKLTSHPAHEAVRAKILPIAEELLVFDFADVEHANAEATA